MKLTADQRNEIRALYALGAMRQDALATQFGISQSGVSAIVQGIETLPRDGSCVLCGAHFLITYERRQAEKKRVLRMLSEERAG